MRAPSPASGNLGSKTKKDRIVGELRDLIASGEIPRGDRLRQGELALRFDTSITPVREALRQLEAEGLLVSQPHRGVRVASADLTEVKAVYVARRLIEPYATARAASRVTGRDLAHAVELTEKMAQAGKSGDGKDVAKANREFHFLFYDRCGMAGLRSIIESLWLDFPWDILHVVSHRLDESPNEHQAIVDFVRQEDLEGTKHAMEGHLRRSYLALAEHLGDTAQVDPFDVDAE